MQHNSHSTVHMYLHTAQCASVWGSHCLSVSLFIYLYLISLLMLAFCKIISWHGHSTFHLFLSLKHRCSCLYCCIMTSAVSCTVSGSFPLSDLLSLLMCHVQASVWWWAWCFISQVLMMRWWTGPESLSSSSTTTMAGPLPLPPLLSYSKRSVWQRVSLCVCLHTCTTHIKSTVFSLVEWELHITFSIGYHILTK